MNRPTAALLLAAAALLSPATASAQVLNPARFDDFGHLVHAGFGADGPLNVDLSYVHSLAAATGAPWVAGARLSLPLVPEGADFELAGLVERGFLSQLGLGASLRAELAVRNAHTAVANTTDAGVHLGVRGGYFGESASIAAELAWERSLLAYVLPTDRYRQQTYAGARAGLYGSSGGLFRLGIAGGVRLGSAELTLRTGIVRSERLAGMDFLPFYAQLGINWAL
ncbi:MAG TPA: hypothetical protein VFA20_28160 [Myxococcaceae bacterium]|nr:hypothetical protein [Myxococcaceae bacterium]